MSTDLPLPLWQSIFGILTATMLVLAAAVWARRARQSPGRHRPDQIAAARGIRHCGQLAGMAVPGLMNLASDDAPLTFTPPAGYRADPDDWTADLPTEVIPAVVEPSPAARAGLDILNQSIRNAGLIAAGKEPEPYARHASPSETAAETARRRWGVECPIFAGLAAECGYHPVLGFDRLAAA